MNRKIFATLVAVLFFYISSPLILPVAMGTVIAVLFYPWLLRMEKAKIPPALGSFLLTLGITLLLLLPLSTVIFFTAKSGFQQLQAFRDSPHAVGNAIGTSGDWVTTFVETPRVHRFLEKITTWLPVGVDELASTTQDAIRGIGAKITDGLGSFLTRLPGMAIGLVIVVVTTYFCLVDGRTLVAFFRRASFLPARQTERLLGMLAGMCRSVILASIVSGGVQAIFEFLACVVTATPNAALVALLVFIGSFIPVLGSAPVTIGVALQQLVEGRPRVAIALFVAAVVVGLIDNFIRPLFLRGSANLHPLLAFVAAFGGLQTLGFVGIFLGPIVAALFITAVQFVAEGDATSK